MALTPWALGCWESNLAMGGHCGASMGLARGLGLTRTFWGDAVLR